VQWDAAALARCPQRREAQLLSLHGGPNVFLSCFQLREAITNAARDGELPILDEGI
jgi:hypothetical protein